MPRLLAPTAFGAALLLLLPGVPAHALGFGQSATSTTLGQPLDFFARLASDGDEVGARECVTADVRVGESKVAPENVRATIETSPLTGERRVRVTTRGKVDEPVVTVDVTVGCTSKMSRRFVAFVDPPMLHLARADAGGFTPQRVESQVAPLVDIVNGAGRARRGAAERQAVAATGSELRPVRPRGRRLAGATQLERTAAATPDARATATGSRRGSHAGAALVATHGPRLRLETALPVLAARPGAPLAASQPQADPVQLARAAASPAAPAAEAPNDAASAALAGERARIASLEASLAQLRSQSQSQQKTLAALQARLREAEGERYANGLVYLLAIGLAFFAVLAGAFWALRPRQRRNARWFEANSRLQRAAAAPAPVQPEPALPRVSQPPSGWDQGPPSILPVTAPASIGGLEVTTVLAPQSHYARLGQDETSANAAMRAGDLATSPIDELADLEQQAEFFAILGQDDAAVAMLDSHLRQRSGSSPLPYLHLLEIHRRRGQRGAFERARIEHGGRFATVSAEWDAAPSGGRALDEHAQALADLQSIWPTPPEAMRMLEHLVLRPSANDASFDLAGYRDLLLLYSVARDLAAPTEADDGSIDLYLPLDEAPTEPLRRDAGGYAVDLDVSGWADLATEDLVIRRSAERRRAG